MLFGLRGSAVGQGPELNQQPHPSLQARSPRIPKDGLWRGGRARTWGCHHGVAEM